MPRGGPDGGDGGRGGSIHAVADRNINTLIDYRYARIHRAKRGENGRGADQYGRGADDIVLRMPVGTVITDADTGELIADLAAHGKTALLAQGRQGRPRQPPLQVEHQSRAAPIDARRGKGEQRRLHLELKVLADVGLLGMPNAGKIDADPRDLGGAAQGRRLSVHDARAAISASCASTKPELRRRRHSRA